MGITLAVFQEAGVEFVEKTNLNKTLNGLTRLYINFLTAKVVKPSGSYVLLTCLQYLSALSTVAGLKSIESIKVSFIFIFLKYLGYIYIYPIITAINRLVLSTID